MPSQPLMNVYLLGVLTLAVAALTSAAVTPAVIRLAHRVGAVDHPGPRKVHASPIPRIGGVAVFAGFLAGLAFAAYATRLPFTFPHVTVYWTFLAAAALALFLLGLVDDLRAVSFQWKFAVQIVAAAVAWSGGFRIEILSSPFSSQPVDLGGWSFALTVLWIVGITNALNLIDGLDGLAAGTALITTVAVAVIAIFREQTGVAVASVALVGSLAGFLRYNFNPARIFLGDSGSMFLGFVLAVISIRGSQKGTTAVAVLAPLLVLGLPLLDTGLALARRAWGLGRDGLREGGGVRYVVRNSRRLFLPDRGHVHHVLVARGLSHRSAVLILYAVVVVLALAALMAVVVNSPTIAAMLVVVLGTSILGFLLFVRKSTPIPPDPPVPPDPPASRAAPPLSPPRPAGHS